MEKFILKYENFILKYENFLRTFVIGITFAICMLIAIKGLSELAVILID